MAQIGHLSDMSVRLYYLKPSQAKLSMPQVTATFGLIDFFSAPNCKIFFC